MFAESELGAAAAGAGGRSEWLRRSGDSVPAETTLAYYDPALDYQTGLQRASRPGSALTSDRRAVAASLDAATAKALSADRLERLWAARSASCNWLFPAGLGAGVMSGSPAARASDNSRWTSTGCAHVRADGRTGAAPTRQGSEPPRP